MKPRNNKIRRVLCVTFIKKGGVEAGNLYGKSLNQFHLIFKE